MSSEIKDKWSFGHQYSFSLYHGRDYGFVLASTAHSYKEMFTTILNTIVLITCTKITLGFLKEEVNRARKSVLPEKE